MAVNYQYAFDSEVQLRNRVYALELPWYVKLQNILIILGATLAAIMALMILIKCGIIALICDCCTEIFKISICRASKDEDHSESHTLNDIGGGLENHNFSEHEEDIPENEQSTGSTNTYIIRKGTPAHMKYMNFECNMCKDVVDNGRLAGLKACKDCNQ